VSYSIERAAHIADQLERLATQHTHQLAGQVSNLEFWMDEAARAIAVIDDYPARFRRLHDAQVSWVRSQDTRVPAYCPICRGACEFSPFTPDPPRRTASEQLTAARSNVRRAAIRFLLRLYRADFVSEQRLRDYADRLELPIEPEDLRPDDENDLTLNSK